MKNNFEINFDDLSNGKMVTDANGVTKWTGTGIMDKLIEVVDQNIQTQHTSGRITGPEYATVYLGSIQAVMTESMKYLLNRQSIELQAESSALDIESKELDIVEKAEKWAIQKKVLDNQLDMSKIDAKYKEAMTLRDVELKDKQLESAAADVSFNESKKTIMENTRNDNIRSKAAEQFAEFMKYISAANAVPGPTDFTNMRNLITAMNTGIAQPNAVASLIQTSGVEGAVDYISLTKV